VQGAAPPGQVRELRVLEHKFRIENPDATYGRIQRLWMRSSQIGIPWRGVRGPKRESRETGGVAEGVNPRLVSS
jgi:hypothetical protein